MRRNPSTRGREVEAVSPVVSTVVITATLFVILMIASFIATSLLELQVENTEFEQAKTNMQLLNNLIMDVALRPGAASSIKFSQRTGGIGIYPAKAPLEITNSSGHRIYPPNNDVKFYVLKYRGGSMVTASNTTLIPQPPSECKRIVSMPESLGHVKVEVGNGAWVVLEYLRVRIATNNTFTIGSTTYNLTEVFILRLKPVETRGSNVVTVKVQSNQLKTYFVNPLPSDGILCVRFSEEDEKVTINSAGGYTPLLRITEVEILVSIT